MLIIEVQAKYYVIVGPYELVKFFSMLEGLKKGITNFEGSFYFPTPLLNDKRQ